MIELTLAKPPAATPPEQPLALSTMLWTSTPMTDMNVMHLDAVTYNNSIYFIGGMRLGVGQSTSVFRRSNGNAITTTWDDMPVPRSGHVSIVVGTKLHIFGGNNLTLSGLINTHSVYDFPTNTWTNETQAGPLIGMGDGVLIGNEIYLLGGQVDTNSETPSKFAGWKYNLTTKVWTELTGLSSIPGQLDVGIAVVGRDIYIVGGRRSGVYNSDFWKYNIDTATVTKLANRPEAYGSRRCVYADSGRILTLMGIISYNTGAPTGYMYWYNPTTDTWTQGPLSPAPRGVTGSARLGRQFYVSGGYNGSNMVVNTQRLYEPA